MGVDLSDLWSLVNRIIDLLNTHGLRTIANILSRHRVNITGVFIPLLERILVARSRYYLFKSLLKDYVSDKLIERYAIESTFFHIETSIWSSIDWRRVIDPKEIRDIVVDGVLEKKGVVNELLDCLGLIIARSHVNGIELIRRNMKSNPTNLRLIEKGCKRIQDIMSSYGCDSISMCDLGAGYTLASTRLLILIDILSEYCGVDCELDLIDIDPFALRVENAVVKVLREHGLRIIVKNLDIVSSGFDKRYNLIYAGFSLHDFSKTFEALEFLYGVEDRAKLMNSILSRGARDSIYNEWLEALNKIVDGLVSEPIGILIILEGLSYMEQVKLDLGFGISDIIMKFLRNSYKNYELLLMPTLTYISKTNIITPYISLYGFPIPYEWYLTDICRTKISLDESLWYKYNILYIIAKLKSKNLCINN